MKKKSFALLFAVKILMVGLAPHALGADYQKDDRYIKEKDLEALKPVAWGKIKNAPSGACSASWVPSWLEDDKVLEFDLSEIIAYAGNALDVDKIYIDEAADFASDGLNFWQESFNAGGLSKDIYLAEPWYSSRDLTGQTKISFCVGSTVQNEVTNSVLESIVLWYDGKAQYPVESLHRFWSEAFQVHFYTVNEDERDNVDENDPNWGYEGVAVLVYEGHRSGTVPVYRFWSNGYKRHFYTIGKAERDSIIRNDPNWGYEGIAYYAFPNSYSGAVATKEVYRYYSETQGHFYTASYAEKLLVDAAISNDTMDYVYEGVAYHAPIWKD